MEMIDGGINMHLLLIAVEEKIKKMKNRPRMSTTPNEKFYTGN